MYIGVSVGDGAIPASGGTGVGAGARFVCFGSFAASGVGSKSEP